MIIAYSHNQPNKRRVDFLLVVFEWAFSFFDINTLLAIPHNDNFDLI